MAIPASALLLSLLCAVVATMSTQSPYVIVEDTAGIQGDITEENQETEAATCEDVMANNGLNFSSFWHGAAHGVHSIYLEEIREYFEPDAPATNRIPVVNTNLSAEHIILFDSPLAGYDEDFRTMAMKVMAHIMLNDRADYATQGINTLEKVTHQYHMHEIYAAAAPIYRAMKANPPKDPELCPCVNDITGNGILKEMTNIAVQLKYFNTKRQPRNLFRARGCGSKVLTSRTRGYDRWESYDNPCDRRKRSTDTDTDTETETVTPAMIAQYEQEYLANSNHQTARNLLDVKPWVMNSLVGPEQWISYEAMLTYSMLEEEELNDFAVFMYCKLNQPGLDHPTDLFD